MLILSSHISIGNLKPFSFVADVEIERSWQTLTNTAKVSFARAVRIKDSNLTLRNAKLSDYVKPGDPVVIKLGYNSNLVVEFEGYVSKVKASIPVEIECEDKMWLLKQNSIIKTWRSGAKLADIIAAILPAGIQFDAADVTIGRYRINRASAAYTLERLRQDYGLQSYFTGGVLKVGFAYQFSDYKTHEVNFQKQVPQGSNNLEYVNEADSRLKLTAISIKPDNSRIEISLGDADGEARTLHYYDLTESELRKIAEQDLSRLKYSGYRGSFTMLGSPSIDHGDFVKIVDEDYPDRSGKYIVDKVNIKHGVTGYRRTITLGRKS